MSWISRADVLVLGLLVAYVLAVVVSVTYRLARREQRNDAALRTKLVADLSIEVGSLRSIASIAPYLGLAGTCVGIFSAFGGIGMEKHAALVMISSRIAAALVTTATGILVALPAICSHNYLRTRIGLLRSEVSNEAVADGHEFRPIAGRFPLRKSFSGLPAFALIAAPSLAILAGTWAAFCDPPTAKGLGIDLASSRCEDDGEGRPIVLHLTDSGKLVLNTETRDWSNLAARLTAIYSNRVHRTLYLVVDDGVSFQTAVDAIDIVKNAPAQEDSSSLDVTIRLITPAAMKARCRIPALTGSDPYAAR